MDLVVSYGMAVGSRSASIKDIAEAVGCSHITVSRALRDSELVRPETKAKIQAAAREMGYVPNRLARSLVTGSTACVGVIVRAITEPVSAELVQAIEQTAATSGYSVILTTSMMDPARELANAAVLESMRIDALIAVAPAADSPAWTSRRRVSVPVVHVSPQARTDTSHFNCTIDVDHYDGAFRATRHLCARGHRRIAYISGPPDTRAEYLRRAGYKAALKHHDLPLDDSLAVQGDGTLHAGKASWQTLVAMRPKPSAVFCFNDMTAIGLLGEALKHGAQVPEDLAVVGFDDAEVSAIFHPSITTFAIPKYEMGRLAFETALRLVRDPGSMATDTHINLSGRLVVRESS